MQGDTISKALRLNPDQASVFSGYLLSLKTMIQWRESQLGRGPKHCRFDGIVKRKSLDS